MSGGGTLTRAAAVADAPGGQVAYTLTSADTAAAGTYRCQFQFTLGGSARVFPATGWLYYEVAEFAAPAAFSALTDFCDPIRAVMGDFRAPFQYEDSAIASVVRSVVNMGQVPGYAVTGNGLAVTPSVTDPLGLLLVVHKSCRTLLRPNLKAFQWRTRAMSTRQGEQRDFLRELENLIYYAEAGSGMSSFQSYYAWVNSLQGINVWGLLTEMKVSGPVATVTIGTVGLQVNTH